MPTDFFFNPSPALQGQLLEALASDQSSINHLAQTFNTTAEAISLFITTDSFATRFTAIGSTNASLVRFSAGLNLHSAVRLLNTLALKLDEQLRTIPVDYTNPVAIEQFRRRAECARQVASALYRLSRFTHEPPRARASNSDSYTTSHQTRTPAPTSTETRVSGTSERSDPATHSPLPVLHQTRTSESTERSDPAAQTPPAIVSSGLPETRASESAERSDPGTYVPAPRDQQPAPTNAAPAHEPAPANTPPNTPPAAPQILAAPAHPGVPSAAAPRSEPSPSASATSRAASVTSVFPPSSPAFPASHPASTPAAASIPPAATSESAERRLIASLPPIPTNLKTATPRDSTPPSASLNATNADQANPTSSRRRPSVLCCGP